jgi:homoserine dehydrogenase
MGETKRVGVGLIGFGVVGEGVARLVRDNAATLTARIGVPIEVVRVAVRDLSRPRGVELDPALFTDDPFRVVDDPKVDIVVEVMGGEHPALELLLAALNKGKPVVTANKALLAIHGEQLYAAAEKNGARLRYEAAIGGVIPIVRTLTGAFAANRIDTVYGIVNGTCNYILTRMAEEGVGYDDALAEAQRLGYAEADPSVDVEGIDAAHKMAILAALAFDTPIDFSDVSVEGIGRISPVDIDMAAAFGYGIKLLGVARRHDDAAVEVRVHPAMVPLDMPIASVNGALNAIEVEGAEMGTNMLVGPGAGQGPTASAVLGDVADLARGLVDGAAVSPRPMNVPVASRVKLPPLPASKAEGRFYLRFTTSDRPGIMAALTKPLGDHGVSIASMIQTEHESDGEETAAVVMLTHRAGGEALAAALAEIDGVGILRSPTVVIRLVGDA